MSLFIQTSKQSPGGRGEERGACLAYHDIRRRGRDPPAVVRIYFRPMIVTGQGELSADHCEVLTKSETFKLITSPDQQSGGLDSVRRQMQCPACYEWLRNWPWRLWVWLTGTSVLSSDPYIVPDISISASHLSRLIIKIFTTHWPAVHSSIKLQQRSDCSAHIHSPLAPSHLIIKAESGDLIERL